MAKSAFGKFIYDCLDGWHRIQSQRKQQSDQQDCLPMCRSEQGRLERSIGYVDWQNESAAFWMGVLTDLKARGVEDILITVTDNLNGFTETIKSVFPASTTQICVVHQIRNSCRYVVWKEKRSSLPI